MTPSDVRRGAVLALVLSVTLAAGGCDLAEAPEPEPAAAEPESLAAPPPAEALRAEAIRDGIRALTEECRRHGGGDWDDWSRQLQGYRSALLARIGAARPNYPDAKDMFSASTILETLGPPTLFEPVPAWYVRYLAEPESIDSFRREMPVAAVSRWLRAQGVDLVFVPAPKMTEVYPDLMASPCPAHRIVAPHLRRILLELLEHDVEVLDPLPAFLAAPDREAPLYVPDDTHWAPRARQMAAEMIAARLRRYAFARYAREGPPLFRRVDLPWGYPVFPFSGALNPDQRRRCTPYFPETYPVVVPTRGVNPVDQHAPVLLIGDSYNEGLVELVARELNTPVAAQTGAGQTVEAVTEGVRNPAVFRGRRVVVWTICNTSLAADARWKLPPQLAPNAVKGPGGP
jgi:hypothetical protein